MLMFKAVILLILGFVLLMKGADWFVDGAAGIAARFGIPQLVIGLTIVAMGTSAPEAAVSINAAWHHNAGITIGNIVGSNILNILVILGIASIITAIAVQKSTVRYEIPFMLLVMVVLMALGMIDGKVGFLDGVILWILFILYLIYLFRMAKKGASSEEEKENIRPLWLQLLTLVIGGVCIVLGSTLTVKNASHIAVGLGMSDRLIGLTIVAFGTSLPELVTSIAAARKHKADIAIGNIVGSNIFNILFVVGTAALITPIEFKPSFVIDSIVSVAAGILLWLGVVKDNKLKRLMGILMVLTYAVYFVYLLLG